MTSRPECPRKDEDADRRPWVRPNGYPDLKKLDRLLGRLIATTDPDRVVLFGFAPRGQILTATSTPVDQEFVQRARAGQARTQRRGGGARDSARTPDGRPLLGATTATVAGPSNQPTREGRR